MMCVCIIDIVMMIIINKIIYWPTTLVVFHFFFILMGLASDLRPVLSSAVALCRVKSSLIRCKSIRMQRLLYPSYPEFYLRGLANKETFFFF